MPPVAETRRTPLPAPAPLRTAGMPGFDDAPAAFDLDEASASPVRFPHRLEDIGSDSESATETDDTVGPLPRPRGRSADAFLGDPAPSAESPETPLQSGERRLERLDRDSGSDATTSTDEPAQADAPIDRNLLAFGEAERGSKTSAPAAKQTSQPAGTGGVGTPMGSGGNVRQATPAENREFIEIAIDFIRQGGSHYEPVYSGRDPNTQQPVFRAPPVTHDQLVRQLDGWKATVENGLRTIRDSLGGDAALDQSLRTTYREAVEKAVGAAASHQGRSRHDLYGQHHERILPFAWPQPTQDPHGNDLSNTLTTTERSRIRVVTTRVTLPAVDRYFAANAQPVALPANTAIRFGGAIPVSLRTGLQSIAGSLVGIGTDGLALNTTLTLGLDLGRVGGDYAAYRFTHVEHPAAAGRPATREILVEHLGNIGLERIDGDRIAAQLARFQQFGFRLGSGWALTTDWNTEPELQALLRGIAALPDADLTQVQGLVFNRASSSSVDPNRDGEYELMSHTISLFDNAFRTSLTRFGTPGAAFADTTSFTIRHEIGHALDQIALRSAMTASTAAATAYNAQVARQQTGFGQYRVGNTNQYQIPPDQRAAWDALQADIAAARTVRDSANATRDAARSRSGGRWERVQGTQNFQTTNTPNDAGSNAFRQAATRDGVRITRYSDVSWMEYFSESYAMYRSAPDDLQRLRPNVFAYFQSQFP